MGLHDPSSTTTDGFTASDQAREALIDDELSGLRELLDRVDGMTHDARQRLRRLERHRHGVAPEWTARHH